MKHLFVISLLLLASCSAPRLYQQGVNKITRAIEKDPSIQLPIDTTIITTTVIKIDTIDNEIIRTITNTIEIVRDTCNFDCDELKTGRQLRFERRMYKDSLRSQEKMYKLETKRLEDSLQQMNKHYKQEVKVLKSDNKTEVKLARQETNQQKGSWFQRQMGKIWWLLLIIGLIAGLFVRSWIPKIPNPFKKKQDG